MSKGIEPLTHKPKGDKEWNESYYLCFSDRVNGLSGMTRLGFKPNKNEGMMFLLLFLPDGSVAAYQTSGEIRSYPNTLDAGGMSHERRPDGSWRYNFTGRMAVVQDPANFPKIRSDPTVVTKMAAASMNLNFKPIHETYEYSANMTPESLELGKKGGDEHWEQIAMINGEVRVDEEVYVLRDVIGQRDHTHGVRDWTGVGNWLYYVVWFNRDLAINPAAIVTDDGRLSIGGFLYKNGRNVPLVGLRIIEQIFRDGVFPISSVLELTDADNGRHILKGQAGPTVPLHFRDENGNISMLAQSFGSFELDGIKGGYGSYETLRVSKN